MPKDNLNTNTRANFGYIHPRYRGAKFEKFFSETLKNSGQICQRTFKQKKLLELKFEIKQRIKPPRFKHFLKGTKLDNSLLTKIRSGRSN